MTKKTPAAVAKNAYKSRRAAAISIGKPVDANGLVVEPKTPVKAAAKTPGKASVKTPGKASVKAPVKVPAGATFTSVDLAAEQGINAKTLRARIRRNIAQWAPLFANGKQHTFTDDAATRKAVAALLD